MSRELELLLEEALVSEWGKKVRTSDGDSFRQKLYVVRKTRSEFKDLMFRLGPQDRNEVWIVRLRGRNPDAPGS